MKENYLAIEIGGTKLQILVGDASYHILERTRFKIDKEKGSEGIMSQIESVLPGLLKKYAIAGAGIGFGGPVDWKQGKIITSHQIHGWSGFSIVSYFEHLIKKPVFLENDANIAALGEALKGVGTKFSKNFYITLGSGVGGGYVVDGEIYHGALPGESEVGHLILDKKGNTLESTSSGWAVDQLIREEASNDSQSRLAKLIQGTQGGEARFLKPALENDDPLAVKILKHTADNLAFALSHVVHLFHPEHIILGGGLSLVGEPLRKEISEAIKKYLMKAFLPGPEISLSSLKEDAVPVGALALAISKIKTQ